MTREDKMDVVKYLRSIDVRTMEFFEEIYDHIITSYELRNNKDQSLNDHLTHTIQPSSGGVKGIQKIMKSQQKLRQKVIAKRGWSLFKSYLFRWPTVLVTILISLIVIQLNTLFSPKDVLMCIMGVSVLIPVIIVLTGQGQFYIQCKHQGKPYSSSDLNLRLLLFASIGTNLTNIMLNIVPKVVWGAHSDSIGKLASYPALQVTRCLLFILYSLVIVQLFKEKFIFKLAT